MKSYLKFFLLIIILAGINLGLDGLFGFDILKYIFKTNIVFIQIIQILIGISAFVCILCFKDN